MKKILVAAFWISINLLFAENTFFNQSLYETKSGDYVFYYDQRDENPALIGIKYLEENLYRLRYYDYSSDKDIFITISVDYTPEKISMSYNDYSGEDFDPEGLLKYTKLFNTLINMQDRVDESIYPNDPSFTQTYRVGDIEHEHTLTYKYWVPVFQAYSINQTIPETKTVSLVAMDVESSEDDTFFDTFKYFPREIEVESVDIPSGDSQTLTYGDISIDIDTNWKNDNGLLLLPIVSDHDAAISLNNWDNQGSIEYAGLHFAYIGLLNNKNFIPANTINITQYNDRTVLEYEIYDSHTRRYTAVTNMYFDYNQKMYIVSVSAFKSFFYDNIEYFNGLLRSIRIVQ